MEEKSKIPKMVIFRFKTRLDVLLYRLGLSFLLIFLFLKIKKIIFKWLLCSCVSYACSCVSNNCYIPMSNFHPNTIVSVHNMLFMFKTCRFLLLGCGQNSQIVDSNYRTSWRKYGKRMIQVEGETKYYGHDHQ